MVDNMVVRKKGRKNLDILTCSKVQIIVLKYGIPILIILDLKVSCLSNTASIVFYFV